MVFVVVVGAAVVAAVVVQRLHTCVYMFGGISSHLHVVRFNMDNNTT